MKKTIVLGASENPARYSHIAVLRLIEAGHPVFPIGMKKGKIGDMDILTETPLIDQIDTITLYVGPQNQKYYEDYIFAIHPKRVIFNPGSENPEFIKKIENQGINVEIACTLVMLSTGSY